MPNKKEDKDIGEYKKLEDYISQKLKLGSNIDEIKEGLVDVGWSEEKVNNAIMELEGKPLRKKPKKTKKIIIDVSIAVILITIFVFVAFNLLDKEENEEIVCDKITDSFSKSECYLELVLDSDNVELCDRLPDDFDVSYCRTSYSLINKEPSVCNGFEKETLFRSCYYQLAMVYKDTAICDYLSEFKIVPDKQQQHDTLNVIENFCNQFVSELDYIDCYNNLLLNITTDCYDLVKKPSFSSCQDLTSEDRIRECYNQIINSPYSIYFDLSKETINHPKEERLHITGLSIITSDTSYCNELKEPHAQWCKSRVSEIEKSFSFCDDLSSLQHMSICYIEYAKFQKSLVFCDRLAQKEEILQQYVDECYSLFS
jgi:hypothetical protein